MAATAPDSSAGGAPAVSAVSASAPESGPYALLILHNVAKRKNFGEIMRSAAAMGVSEVCIVGAQKLSAFGAQGCAGHLRFSHFNKLPDCVAYVKNVHGALICGIEITDDAKAVQSHPFQGTTAFIVGNEGHGLTEAQLAICDHCVYIPQHSAATASLNVNAACAIVLHHYAIWAGIQEVCAPPPPRGVCAHRSFVHPTRTDLGSSFRACAHFSRLFSHGLDPPP